jgi:hypothetical protein
MPLRVASARDDVLRSVERWEPRLPGNRFRSETQFDPCISNTKSPLNGLAAKWAAQNSHLLPIDPRPVAPPFNDASRVQAPEGGEAPPLAQPMAEVPAPVAEQWSERIVIGSENPTISHPDELKIEATAGSEGGAIGGE